MSGSTTAGATYPFLPNVRLDAANLNAAFAQAYNAAGQTVVASIAAAGASQSTATQLSANTSVVQTVDNLAGVILAPLPYQRVLNRGLNALVIWAPPGCQIDSNGINGFVTLDPGGQASFAQAPTNQFWSH